ncbi:hypothetical protein CPB86DRAFT_715867, partial [Serendipita vermifera]
KSIYYLFVDETEHRCLFCGSIKTSFTRAVNCVRSHLGHRPFQCGGESMGCSRCNAMSGYSEFFAEVTLKDHLAAPSKRVECAHQAW